MPPGPPSAASEGSRTRRTTRVAPARLASTPLANTLLAYTLLASGAVLSACSIDSRPVTAPGDNGLGGTQTAGDDDAGDQSTAGTGGTAGTSTGNGGSSGNGGSAGTIGTSNGNGGTSSDLPIDQACDAGNCPVDQPPGCAGCLIEGVCEASGTTRTGNVCEVCDPAQATDAWSAATGSCDDGLFCTQGDTCQAGICVGGGPFPCEDDAACNGVSTCDEANDTCTVPETICGAGTLCDVDSDSCVSTCNGCVISGSCVASGTTQPGNTCRICDPARSSVAYSPNTSATCGSGASECSAQDTCNAGGVCQRNDNAEGSACGPNGGRFCLAGVCNSCDDGSDPDALCEDRSGNAPLCDFSSGTCAACLPSTCGGTSPRCEPSVGCLPCTEHSHCPNTACHLSGPLQGSCFSTGDTVQVSAVSALTTQLTSLTPGQPKAIRLAGVTFSSTDFLDIQGDGVEVAIIGQAGTVLTGGPTNGIPFYMNLGFDTIAYVAGITFQTGPRSALACSSDSILWLDDAVISGYPTTALTGACEGHLRRSRLRSTGIALSWQAGDLFMENSSLGSGGSLGLQTLNSPRLDIRYSTIVGNTTALACDASPGPSGQIRNSILLGTGDPAISGSACELVTYAGNAVNTAGDFGTVVGFDAAWFANAAAGDMHLTAQGAGAIGNLATRASGDPTVDIDGQTRPTTGRPGVDQR